jgi:integrase
MPPKNPTIPLPRYITAYRRQKRVAYKYQRDVPKALQPLLDRKRWEHSLGSDLATALDRGRAYTAEHNRIIGLLSDNASLSDVVRKGVERIAAAKMAEDIEEAPVALAMSWRDTEDHMTGAGKLSPQYERESLATFALQAFGDKSHIDQIEDPSPMLQAALSLPVALPPSGGDTMSLALYTAMQKVLNDRLAVLVGVSKESDEYRLSALREKYFKLNNCSAGTIRNYRGKIDAMTRKIGDLPLHQITPEKLRDYRDHLLEKGHKPDSVAQYFAPVKAIMRWAISEDLVPNFDAMPTDKVKMPRGGAHVEETRWQRFDDEEIKKVWGVVQKAWGPDSRYDADRQAAFKWAFRVALYTAARPVEIFRMKPENVTAENIHLTETKTRISRKLPLSKHLDGFYEYMQDGGWKLNGKPESASSTMSDSFTKAIRAAGFTNSRHVLYSAKDTLVDRLQRAGRSDDVIRGITGHVSGQGQLRNYKTRLNDTPEGLAMLREALDAVVYW